MRMRRCLVLLLIVLALSGCASERPQQSDLVKVAWKDLSPDWLKSNDQGQPLRPNYLFGNADRYLNELGVKSLGADTKVLIVQRGETPSGGYGIMVKDIMLNPQKQLVVQMEKMDPKPGEAVTLTSTYPMTAVSFPDVGAKEIVFEPALDTLAVKPSAVKQPLPYTGSLSGFARPVGRGAYLYPLDGNTLIVVEEAAVPKDHRMDLVDVQIADELKLLTARVGLIPPAPSREIANGGVALTPSLPSVLAGTLVDDYTSYRLRVEYLAVQSNSPSTEQRGWLTNVSPGMVVPIHPEPQPELLAPTGELQPDDQITILGFMGHWIQIKSDSAQGWVPSWYLEPNQRNEAIQKLKTPTERVLTRSSPVSLYPAGPKVGDLPAGKLLTVRYCYKDWAFVDVIVYDIPAVQFGWVKQELLADLDQSTSNEGYLKLGAKVYRDFEQKQLLETSTYRKAVMIQERRGRMAYLFAAGGWDGWTELGNIVYQPE